MYAIYYFNDTNNNVASIPSSAKKLMQRTKEGSNHYGVGGYKYIALPTRLGGFTAVDVNTRFEVPFDRVASFTHEGINYTTFRSTNLLNGSINIKFK